MSRCTRCPKGLTGLAVLLCGAVASAADPAPPSGAASTTASTVEDRLRGVESANQALAAQLRNLQLRLSVPPPAAAAPASSPPAETSSTEPFAWGDFTWMNGASRMTTKVLDTKYFTPQLDIDSNYTWSFNRPIDDTLVGSTATARHNELVLAFLGAGGDAHIGNVRGRIFFQYGTRSTAVPRNDLTVNRGQFDLLTVYRYLSEAYAGYHFNKLEGINLDVGLFFSYVGLFSYTQYENWGYQASFTSDNTPWFFNGARLQIFPSDRLKVEIWLINGWQTYGKFNELPGVGYQIRYAPEEWLNLVFNGYVGTDTIDHPGRVRFHSDNSVLVRYYNHPNARGLSRGALSATFDLGFEEGDGVAAFRGNGTEGNCTNATPCEQDFVSGMAYNMLWFHKNQLSWMAGGGFIHNPGRYLVLVPTGVAASAFDTNSGTKFDGYDFSTNVSWYPSENLTFRLEASYHNASVPYYAGRGGVTGPDGFKCGGLYNPDGTISTCIPTGWTPDLVKSETKLIFALLFRL
ncbi:outer membrane beta-barrel protein [Mycobacterium sp.]|uniref:outer membrane beta-barrel protein n=1 Tax=Mycobacterium sp. TaxID=1785 RepID=UPI00333F0054|nr:beta-barrel porin-2 [Mycobacterium sp.]